MQKFQYIVANPQILQGKPCIVDTRISVEFVLDMIVSGASIHDIHQTYPYLKPEAIREAIEFAKYWLKNDSSIEISFAS
jgi:uncharacterized protein (DUF433 family)